MSIKTFAFMTTWIAAGVSQKDHSGFNHGWSSSIAYEPYDFHNLSLTWETDTPIPVYVDNHKDDSRFNVGWSSFLADEPTEFHNLALTWETDTPIPDYVVGSYIKNGPSQKSFGSENRWYNSYLDSWAKLNKITFSPEGEVHFSGRMIESRNFVRCRDANKIKPSITMGGVTRGDFSMMEMIEGVMHGFDNTNVLLWRLGSETNGTYIASTDYPLVHMIDPDNLGVLRQATSPLRDGLTLTSSSHWIREVGTDNSLNFAIIMNPLTMDLDFVLYRYGSTMEDREEVARFPAPWLSMIHMISTSEHYAVIIFYPVKMNMISAPCKYFPASLHFYFIRMSGFCFDLHLQCMINLLY